MVAEWCWAQKLTQHQHTKWSLSFASSFCKLCGARKVPDTAARLAKLRQIVLQKRFGLRDQVSTMACHGILPQRIQGNKPRSVSPLAPQLLSFELQDTAERVTRSASDYSDYSDRSPELTACRVVQQLPKSEDSDSAGGHLRVESMASVSFKVTTGAEGGGNSIWDADKAAAPPGQWEVPPGASHGVPIIAPWRRKHHQDGAMTAMSLRPLVFLMPILHISFRHTQLRYITCHRIFISPTSTELGRILLNAINMSGMVPWLKASSGRAKHVDLCKGLPPQEMEDRDHDGRNGEDLMQIQKQVDFVDCFLSSLSVLCPFRCQCGLYIYTYNTGRCTLLVCVGIIGEYGLKSCFSRTLLARKAELQRVGWRLSTPMLCWTLDRRRSWRFETHGLEKVAGPRLRIMASKKSHG